MLNRSRIIPSLLLLVFTIFALGEVAGFRVHHTASIKLFHLSSDEGDKDDHNGHPCHDDESLMEHVFHQSANNACDGSGAPSLSMLISMLPLSAAVIIPPLDNIHHPSARDRIMPTGVRPSIAAYRAPPMIPS